MTQQRVSPVSITSVLPATVTLSVQAALGQSANIFEVKNSSGTVLTNISTGGNIIIGRNGAAPIGSAAFTAQNAPAFAHYNTDNTAINAFASLFVRGNSTGNVMYMAQLGDTANGVAAITWLNTSSVEVFRIGIAGNTINTISNAAVVGSIIKGAASQSADYFQIQNSAGSVRAYISAGAVIGTAVGFANLANTGTYLDTSTNTMTFIQRVAATPVLAVRGAASQTANLQEWQDSSPVILASVSSSGVVRGASVRSINDYSSLLEANSGGYVRLTKQTAATPNPGAGLGSLYFRDGTNAGTLKLVVRAGAAGAETTILDNIPQ